MSVRWTRSTVGPLRPILAATVMSVIALPVSSAAGGAQSLSTCSPCDLRLEVAVTIGSPDGPGSESVMSRSSVAIDGRGRIIVTALGADRFSVFTPAGEFIRYVGRSGQGPGEYQFIWGLAASRDWVHVFDPMNGRRTLLDLDFSVDRVDQVSGPVRRPTALDSGSVAFFSDIASRDQVGMLVHVLRPDGSMRSFGRGDGGYHKRLPQHAFGTDGVRAWTVPEQGDLSLSEWDLATGDLLRTIPMDLEWYSDWDDDYWPRSLVVDVRPEGGRALLFGAIPDRQIEDNRVRVGDPSAPTGDLPDLMTGVLDLIDLGTGASLGSLVVEGWIVGFVSNSDLVAVYRETASGVPFIDLARVIGVQSTGG